MNRVIGLCWLLLSVAVMTSAVAAEHPILVTPQWVAEKLGDSEYVVLHVATLRADYTREHIPGSRFLWQYSISESTPERNTEPLPVATLDSVLEEVGVSSSTKIILCYVLGDVGAAARVYVMLDWLGMGSQTYILNGGFEGWKAAGQPVSREIPVVARGSFEPRLQPDVFAELDYVRAHYRNKGIRMIDGRSAQVFNQAGGVGVFRGGHIPGAINIPWGVVIDTTNQFRPLDSIDLTIAKAGIQPTDELITYCALGRTACLQYVVAKSLGYRVRLYDGSFEEWSRIEDLPVEVTPSKEEVKATGR
jgi:thiosulfate/3-mercaptopyruvate sulfurtransferase